jgi:hypothetical protein
MTTSVVCLVAVRGAANEFLRTLLDWDSPRYGKRRSCNLQSADLSAHCSIFECKTRPDAGVVAVVIFEDTTFGGGRVLIISGCGRVDSDGRSLG